MPRTMTKKTRHFVVKLWLYAGCVAACASYGCSSSESDDENLEGGDDSGENNLGGDDAKEGNGQENYVDTEEGKDSKDSADVNSAVGGDAGAGGSGDLLGNGGAIPGNAPPANAPVNGAALDAPPPTNNAAPGGNLAASSPPANENAAPTAPAAPPAAAAPAPGGTTPIPGGRVRYVREGGIQAVSAPTGGSPVATLEQGEHPLTWEENGWLRITTGMYVPLDGMSTSGVARPQGAGGWNH